jgi:hypothetical protein
MARGPDRSHIRALPAYRIEREIERRMSALRLAWGIDAGRASPESRIRIARALRGARRLARRGYDYDLLRHWALARLARAAGLAGAAGTPQTIPESRRLVFRSILRGRIGGTRCAPVTSAGTRSRSRR